MHPQSTNNGGPGSIEAYFRSQHPSNNSNPQPKANTTSEPSASGSATSTHVKNVQLLLTRLSTPLQSPDLQGLTRSQRLFSIATHTDIRSLSISGSPEFFLFMDMRAEKGWASFKMTPRAWVAAANEYNTRLKALGEDKDMLIVQKNPIALVNMLGQLETKISNRILTGNFLCEPYNKFFMILLCYEELMICHLFKLVETTTCFGKNTVPLSLWSS
jgi:hypothetical protein